MKMYPEVSRPKISIELTAEEAEDLIGIVGRVANCNLSQLLYDALKERAVRQSVRYTGSLKREP